ncbi:MAG: MATE family efflux transporter, partial [Deltaproteobacteria bacterium]
MRGSRRISLTDGPVERTLVRLAVPIMFGLVSIILFNVVDTFYIGMLGAEP